MFRKILKSILSLLSKWAISKHNIELIVVTGFHGSEIVREGIYATLNQTHKVRRNTDQIVWDMALPLAVLGYKDKKRNPFEWIVLCIRGFLYLLLGPKNDHILILNANCTFKETAKFWSSFLKPDYLVILNYEQDSAIVNLLLERLARNEGELVYNKDEVPAKLIEKYKVESVLTYGKQADIHYDAKQNIISYKDNVLAIPKDLPKFAVFYYTAITAFAIKHGEPMDRLKEFIVRFDLGQFLTERIKSNLEKR